VPADPAWVKQSALLIGRPCYQAQFHAAASSLVDGLVILSMIRHRGHAVVAGVARVSDCLISAFKDCHAVDDGLPLVAWLFTALYQTCALSCCGGGVGSLLAVLVPV
jgi:hypothetical protein